MTGQCVCATRAFALPHRWLSINLGLVLTCFDIVLWGKAWPRDLLFLAMLSDRREEPVEVRVPRLRPVIKPQRNQCEHHSVSQDFTKRYLYERTESGFETCFGWDRWDPAPKVLGSYTPKTSTLSLTNIRYGWRWFMIGHFSWAY